MQPKLLIDCCIEKSSLTFTAPTAADPPEGSENREHIFNTDDWRKPVESHFLPFPLYL